MVGLLYCDQTFLLKQHQCVRIRKLHRHVKKGHQVMHFLIKALVTTCTLDSFIDLHKKGIFVLLDGSNFWMI